MPSGEFTDIALMVGRIGDGHPRSTPNGRHFDEPVEVGPDLYIGPLGEIAKAFMDACTPPGENTLLPERQFGSRYAFFRRNAPAKPSFEWDSDGKLSILMMLSRLIDRRASRCSMLLESSRLPPVSVKSFQPGAVWGLAATSLAKRTIGCGTTMSTGCGTYGMRSHAFAMRFQTVYVEQCGTMSMPPSSITPK
jgi:hypothetical protein